MEYCPRSRATQKSTDAIEATIQPRSFGEQPAAQPPQPSSVHDFSQVDLFSHAPQHRPSPNPIQAKLAATIQRQCEACAAEEEVVQRTINDIPQMQSDPERASTATVIQKREVCDAAGVCWSEAGPDESSYESNTTLAANVGTLTPSSPQQQQSPDQPVFEAYKGQSINQVGYVSSSAKEYEIAKTAGVNVRAKPDGTLPSIAKVLYGNKVQVQALDTTNAFYFIIADAGAVGWVNKNFIALDPPDAGAKLHHIKESNLTTILKNEYVDKGLWQLSTGNDYTTLAAAVVVANKGRIGVTVDWEKAEKYKQDSTLKRLFDPWMIDNFAIYHGSEILAGHNIWLPSVNYVRMLQSSGVVGSRPGWINTAVKVGQGIGGFFAGLAAGVFGSLWDTLTGLWELGKSIIDTVKSVLDGSLFASVEAIYDAVDKMEWSDFQKMVNEIITMGQNAFNNFEQQWDHPDMYKQWHFKGYTIGAIALEVVLAIFTGGGTLGAKVLAKIGKYFPKLMGVLSKLLKVADKLDFRTKQGKGHPHKPKDHDRDRDNDTDNMSDGDRAWEQARVMASLIAEQHDVLDTPVEQVITLLNTTIAPKFKGVTRYKEIEQSPNTFQIIQLSRRNNVVDRHYTDKERRQQYKQRAQRADDAGGHSYRDHGAHTTPEFHQQLLKSGKKDVSSKFATHKVHADALERAWVKFTSNPGNMVKANGTSKKKAAITLDMDGAGFSYKLDPADSSKTKLLSEKANHVCAIFKPNDPDGKTWRLVTMFPTTDPNRCN